MAHYAFLDENNIVTEVIVGRNEDEVVNGISDWEAYYGQLRQQKCLRTSYNANIRGNYAGIGMTYDETNDVFLYPKDYPSWVLNDEFKWVPPVDYPFTVEYQKANRDCQRYVWDEESVSWIEFNTILPQPFPSWILGANNQWYAPVDKPNADGEWIWDEPTLQWVR